MKIEVSISIDDYPNNWKLTPASYESWIIGKLKDAGIPIDGTFLYHGLKSGALTRYDDPADFSMVKYVWEDTTDSQ